MAFLLFFVLSVIAAMVFNFVHTKVWANARFLATQGRYSGKQLYAFNTVATAGVIFVAILVAAMLMKAAGERASIPTA
jgi:uncharacterized membrane protein YjgN (DUF898 family)